MATRSNTAGTKAAKQADAADKKAEAAPVESVEKKPVVRDIDVHQSVPVKSGFQGMLIYRSRRTGEEFIWKSFGDEQEMELQELKNAKASNKGFFENNWFMFGDEYAWVIDWLGVNGFYRNALKVDDFDDIFRLPPDKIRDAAKALPEGQKSSLGYRARQLVADGTIDSIKAITALEDALGVQLVER